MSEKIKEYAIYPGQIKINNEIFFGLDYKLTDFYNELAEENKQLKSQLQQKENIIKEAREYINNHFYMESTGGIQHPTFDGKMNRDTNGFELLEILDKVSDE